MIKETPGDASGYLPATKEHDMNYNPKLCPLTFNVSPNEACKSTHECSQEYCEWWNAEARKCAIALIADSARKQVKK